MARAQLRHRLDAVARDLEQCAVAAEHAQRRPGGLGAVRGAARRARLAGPEPRDEQLALDGAGRGIDQQLRLGRDDLLAARDVDDPEDAARLGVVHRSGGARPRLHEPVEVLGAADLHRSVEGDRGSRAHEVPTASSDQFAPATKPMSPVSARMLRSPSTHRRRPAASPTATTTPESSRSPGTSSPRIMSMTPASGCARRYSSSSADARSSGGRSSAPTRLASERRHESRTSGRTSSRRRSPTLPATSSSWARSIRSREFSGEASRLRRPR